MTHTPGPWKYGKSAHPKDGAYDWGIKALVAGGFEVVAEAFGRSSEDGYPPAEANAKLIAAAPDLLHALELVLPLAKGYSPSGQTDTAKATCKSWIEAAEAAITSATG